ncbi:uncharacterized protein [Drosophila virilis]|uniref:Protein krueppel n=1 Tax=Drosophila virilis TaxID=7244 RepID=B4M0L1_DROVI|nr:zinc finger protein 668 [Drosophila virilis]EDW68390.2 uncharacterized protein Dvir_GJ22561 [Drosophila virilis]
MDAIKKTPVVASQCRVCLGEYDESTMQTLSTENNDADNDNTDGEDEGIQSAAFDKQHLSRSIEYCCGIRIRRSMQLPSLVCERCCDFVRMWFSFRQMCLNTQVYLESLSLHDEKPDNQITSTSEYMEYLYETLQLQALYREKLESVGSPEMGSDYVVDYDDDSIVADATMPPDELDECPKHYLPEIITELEAYEADEGEPIEVEPALIYADDSQTAEADLPLKLEHCDADYDDDNDGFLSPTPSPEPKPTTTAKRKPGRPRKPDSELKSKRKIKGEQLAKNEQQTEDMPTKYMCNLCGNVYPKKAAFTAHMMAHTDYKPHQCEICCKSFRQMGELRAHIRRHTGERPYKCLYCDRHFYDRSEKVRHERVHTNTRPYECKECGKTFTHTAILKNHSLVHSGEKNFNCNICSKSFTLLHQLKAHLQTLTHRSKEEQAFASSSSYILSQENLE